MPNATNNDLYLAVGELKATVQRLVDDSDLHNANHWPHVFDSLAKLETRMSMIITGIGIIFTGVISGSAYFLIRFLAGG